MSDYTQIKTTDDVLWTTNCPIMVNRYTILKNIEDETNVLRIRIQNICRLPITSTEFSVNIFSKENEIIESKDLTFSNLSVDPGQFWGEETDLPISINADHFEFIVKTVGLNSKEYSLDFLLESYLAQIENDSSLINYSKFKELVANKKGYSNNVPIFQDNYWYCSCGQFNANNYCVNCGITKTDLMDIYENSKDSPRKILSAEEMPNLFGDDSSSEQENCSQAEDNRPTSKESTIICPECQAIIPADSITCPKCGYPIKRKLPSLFSNCINRVKNDRKLLYIICGVVAVIIILIVIIIASTRHSKNNIHNESVNNDASTIEEIPEETDSNKINLVNQEEIEKINTVVDSVFEGLQQGRFEDVKNYLDADYDFYKNIYQISDENVLKLLYSKYSYEIQSVDIDEDKELAFATIELAHPDAQDLLQSQIEGWSFDPNSMTNAIKTKLNSSDLKVSTDSVQLSFIKNSDNWVVYTKDDTFNTMLNYGMTQKADVASITENEKRIQEKKEYINNYIVLSDYIVEECTGYSGTVPGLHYLSIKNNGDQDITSLSVGLDFLNDDGSVSYHKDIQVIGSYFAAASNIKAGYSWKMEDDKFYEIDNLPDGTNLSKVNVYVSDVTLEVHSETNNQSAEEEYIEQYLDVSAKVGMNSSYHGTVPGISDISIKNNGDRDIKELTVIVYFQDESGKNIAEDSFMVIGGYFGGDTLKANYSWKMENNKFYEFENLADEVDISRNIVKIGSITFE